jgi:hypothetical protein
LKLAQYTKEKGMKKLRALFVGAHPDDCEIGGGGLAIRLVRRGREVKFCSVADGRSGAYRDWGGKTVPLRTDGMKKTGKLIGCERVFKQ